MTQFAEQSSPPHFPGSAYDVVAIAASAGGLNAVSEVLGGLPSTFPAAVIIVQHLAPEHKSLLTDILSRRTAMQVREAGNGAVLAPGSVYVAPPDHHLVVETDGSLALSDAAPVHFVRPAADVVFESIARSYRDRAVVVVLTGGDHDGAAGVQAIKGRGAKSWPKTRRHPSTSACPELPSSPATLTEYWRCRMWRRS